MKMNNKSQKTFIIIIIILILAFGIARIIRQKPPVENEEEIIEETTEEEITQEETTEESEEETEQVMTFPEPQYGFREEEVTIPISGVDREYRLAWVSDVHLITDHTPGDGVKEEFVDTLMERYNILPVDANGIHAEDLWPEIIKYLNYNEFDLIIFGGDIMDYCSESNLNTVKEGLDSLRHPYIYIRADHDYGSWYGGDEYTENTTQELHKTIDGDEISSKFWDFGDFILLGVDRSTKDMPDYYLNMIEDVYSRGKPVIMATHVPYASQVDSSLEDLSLQVRNKIYYWGGGDYVPNNITSAYLNDIYSDDTVVKEVLAGHLHASWDGMISEQVSQHIFGPAFAGNIGIIHVIPEEN